jgi:phosphomannomutase
MKDKRLKAELLVDSWLGTDFCNQTRVEATVLLHEEKYSEIEARLGGQRKLVFGTAGLRARMGVGYDRMNCVTVIQTTQGLVAYLENSGLIEPNSSSVVIGFDGRHNSESFAHVTASVFIEKGIKVYFLNTPSPTPLNPFLITQKKALCGIQITASHNPKDDNGYKLYWSNGAQIIPPIDSAIAETIESNRQIGQAVFKVLDNSSLRLRSSIPPELFEDVSKSALCEYIEAISKDVCKTYESNQTSTVRFAYTAMHGVGFHTFKTLFEKYGFDSGKVLLPVEAQKLPDPEFPTVKFPNPEEKGALSLAIAEATKFHCEVVLANDPDADRFTSAEQQKDGSWYQFTGDEIGLLFADWQMMQSKSGLFVTSVVSSKMMSELVKHRTGYVYSDCLTGFKWIANESIRLIKEGKAEKHLLGYEEAIGYQLSGLVPDKDGISAACVWAEMVCHWRRNGLTLKQRLGDILKNEIGFFVTNNGYYIIDDPNVTRAVFDDFRMRTDQTQIGGYTIRSIRDVTKGTDSSLKPGEKGHLPATPDAEMIQIFFENGAVVTIRASGTEPKVKFYSEMSSNISREDAATKLNEIVNVIKRDFYQPHRFTMREQPSM